jgi:hypothetical protein
MIKLLSLVGTLLLGIHLCDSQHKRSPAPFLAFYPIIVFSYRRSDTFFEVRRIRERLGARFGADSIIQIDVAPTEMDFPTYVEDIVKNSKIVLAVVGPEWVGDYEGSDIGIRRDEDPIRIQLETAYRCKKRVLPILVRGASPPRPNQLPTSIRSLSFQNFVQIRDKFFDQDMRMLIEIINSYVGKENFSTPPTQTSADPGSSAPTVEPTVTDREAANEGGERSASLKIVISYRRSDSAGVSGRLFDRLVARFSKSSIYMDVDNIPFGVNFRAHIEKALQDCNVLIVVVGRNWLGKRLWFTPRIFDDDDPVRAELETALQRKIRMVPVLVDGAFMPSARQLPPTLAEFADLNAAELSSGRDFNAHAERLIDSLRMASM